MHDELQIEYQHSIGLTYFVKYTLANRVYFLFARFIIRAVMDGFRLRSYNKFQLSL